MAFENPQLLFQVGANIDGFKQAMSDLSDSTLEDLGKVNPAIADIASGLNGITINENVHGGLGDLKTSADDAANSVHEVDGGLKDMAERLGHLAEALVVTEALREFGTEALTVFGNLQKADIALTAITGDAALAKAQIEGLKDLALEDALSFPALLTANQRLNAFGLASEAIPPFLTAIADAAAGMNKPFEDTASSMERIIESGTLMPKGLVALGLNMNDVATAMGTTAGEAKKLFTELDIGDRAQVLEDALAKYAGQAELAAQGIAGEWEKMKTSVDFAMEEIGASLAPIISSVLDKLIPAIQSLTTTWKELPDSTKNTILDGGIVVTAIAAVSAGLSGLGLLISGVSTALTGLFELPGLSTLVAGAGAATGALALPFTGAAVATGVDLQKLSAQWADFDASVQKSTIMSLLGQGQDGIDKLWLDYGISIDQAKASFVGLDGESINVKKGLDDLGITITGLETPTSDVKDKVAALAKAHADAAALADANKTAQHDFGTINAVVAGDLKSNYIPVLTDAWTAQENVNNALFDSNRAAAESKNALAQLTIAYADGHGTLTDLVAAHTAVVNAEATEKTAHENLTFAQKNLADEQRVDKQVATDLAAAHKVLADYFTETSIPAVVSLHDAESKLAADRAQYDQDIATYANAEIALVTARANATTDTDPALIAAEKSIDTARQNVSASAKQVKKDETDLITSRNELKTQTDLNIRGEEDFNSALKTLGVQTFPDLNTAIETIVSKQGDLVTAVNNSQHAQTDMNAAYAEFGPKSEQYLNAVTDFKTAKDLEAKANRDVNATMGEAQNQYSLTKSAVGLLAGEVSGLLTPQQLLDLAFANTGQRTLPDLQAATDSAKRSYLLINAAVSDGTASVQEAGRAWLKYYGELVAQTEASGGSVSAADQIMYASLKQQQIDYVADSITRWSDYYNKIHGDVAGLFSGLTTDLFTGGDFLKTFENFAQKIGEDTMNAILQPLEHAAEQWVSQTLSKLLSDVFGPIFASAIGLGSNAGLAGAAATLQTGAVTLQTAATTLESAATSLQAQVGGSAASAAGSAGGAAGGGGGGAASAAGGLLNAVTGVVTAIGAVAGAIAGFIGDAELSNIKDTLHHMRDDLNGVTRAVVLPGGIYESSFATAQNTGGILTYPDLLQGLNAHAAIVTQTASSDAVTANIILQEIADNTGALKWNLIPDIDLIASLMEYNVAPPLTAIASTLDSMRVSADKTLSVISQLPQQLTANTYSLSSLNDTASRSLQLTQSTPPVIQNNITLQVRLDSGQLVDAMITNLNSLGLHP